MLPKIVENVSTQSSIILRLISKYSQQNRREMLFNNFKYIFSYLLRTITDEAHLEKCLHYLQVLYCWIDLDLLLPVCIFLDGI